jgi:hypothetical protein
MHCAAVSDEHSSGHWLIAPPTALGSAGAVLVISCCNPHGLTLLSFLLHITFFPAEQGGKGLWGRCVPL